jgi:hypothetical protein
MALYVMAYTLGRGWIEMLRIDDVEYQHVLGLRLNVWTSIVLFVLAAVYFVVVGRREPVRETVVYTDRRLAEDRAAAGGVEEGNAVDASMTPSEDEPDAVVEPDPVVERSRDHPTDPVG